MDTYSTDGGDTTQTAGLTFGPALGDNKDEDGTGYIKTYKAHLTQEEYTNGKGYCIHWMTWDEIIEQSATNPTVFEDCKENGCTKTVELTPNETLFNMETVANAAEQGYTGDGVSTLFHLLNGTGSEEHTAAAVWNWDYDDSSSDPSNIYSKSRIRVTLNGDSSDAELKYASSGGESGDGSDLCNESNCLLSCFPSDLQNAIVPRTVQASNSSYDKTTYDKLWLPTISEIGITYASDNGMNYDIASSDNNSEREAYEFSDEKATGSSKQAWWSRSRNSSSDIAAEYVTASGSNNSHLVTNYHGLSPGFCIK